MTCDIENMYLHDFYWCYCPHMSKDSVSPIFADLLIMWLEIGLNWNMMAAVGLDLYRILILAADDAENKEN